MRCPAIEPTRRNLRATKWFEFECNHEVILVPHESTRTRMCCNDYDVGARADKNSSSTLDRNRPTLIRDQQTNPVEEHRNRNFSGRIGRLPRDSFTRRLAPCLVFALRTCAVLSDNSAAFTPRPTVPRESQAEGLFESQSICQSYKGLSPPLFHRRCMSMGDDGLRLSSNNDGRRLRPRAKPNAKDAVLILDLDKTSIYGNDGNDLGISLQWMEQPDSVVKDLYKLLVSPCIKPAYEEMKARAEKVDVVIYTRRPQVLKYQSCFRDCNIPIQYADEWHHDGQLYFPSHIRTADDVMSTYCGPQLVEDEVNDVKKSLERLIAARDAITENLGLEKCPTVVVTATDKCVEETVKHLELSEVNAVLFDDNKALQYDPRTVTVDPLEALPEPHRRDILDFMETHLPAKELEEELVEYLEDAKESEKAIEWDSQRHCYSWRVPLSRRPVQNWRVPELKRATSPWDRASDSGFGLPPWARDKSRSTLIKMDPRTSMSNGALSPVTPADEVQVQKSANEELRSGMVDLKAAAERALKLREEQAMFS